MKRIIIYIMLVFVMTSLPQFTYAQAIGGEIKRPVKTTTTTTPVKQNSSPNKPAPKPKPTTGTLSISSTPSDASVKINGEYIGTTPLKLSKHKTGTYKVTFSAEGYETTEKSVTVTAGGTATCSATLKKKQTQQPIGQQSVQQTPDKVFTVNDFSFVMVPVEGATFQMGSNDSEADSDEKPVHSVTLSSYYISQTEVTQALWKAVMGNNPSHFRGDKLPVEMVSWKDCQTFINKLNQLTGKNFRLPTEAEWEYAARGGNKSRGYKYAGGNTLDEVAWYEDNSNNKTHEVATKQPNELGIYDMSGNVWEWCQDWYGDYSNSYQTNPKGASTGSYRVNRGGSWCYNSEFSRSSLRYHYDPAYRDFYLGLRLALTP